MRPCRVIFEIAIAPQRSSPSLRVMQTSRLVPMILLIPVSPSFRERMGIGTSVPTSLPNTSRRWQPQKRSAAALKNTTWLRSSMITTASLACSRVCAKKSAASSPVVDPTLISIAATACMPSRSSSLITVKRHQEPSNWRGPVLEATPGTAQRG